jgi:TolA-binding protein
MKTNPFQFLLLSFLVLVLGIAACDSPARRLAAIEKTEKALETAVDGAASKDNPADKLLDQYLGFVKKYPADSSSAEMLYRAAMLKADRFQQFDACIALFEQLRREYPAHRRSENALFLIGYTYAEQLKNLDQARTYYQTFLQQYPASELRTSVEFELANLGKPVEELEIFKAITSPDATAAAPVEKK